MKHILAAVLLVLWTASLTAAELPPAIQTLQNQGANIGESFPGPDGLTGWVVRIPGHTFIVFSTPGGTYAVSGILVDRNGTNLIPQYEDRYIHGPAAVKIAATLATDDTLVKEGDVHAPLIYVYADANCSYCNQLWNQLRSPLQAGKVQVHWVLVSFLKDTSPGRAAAIIGAKDKVAALTLDETQFDKSREEGGIPPAQSMSAETNKALQLHAAQMADAGADGTPLLVFKRGGNWTSAEGLPKNLDAFLAALDPSK